MVYLLCQAIHRQESTKPSGEMDEIENEHDSGVTIYS